MLLPPANEVIPQSHDEAAEAPRELAREDHLDEDVPALAAVRLVDADAVEARPRELVEELERPLRLVPLELARPALGRLAVDPRAGLLLEEREVLAELEVHRAQAGIVRLSRSRG